MAAQSFGSLRSAYRLTDLTVILADGSKPIGNLCRNSSTKVLLAIKRGQQMRLPDNELIKENSEQALSGAYLATSMSATGTQQTIDAAAALSVCRG